MPFGRTILMLVSLVCAVMVPIFVGHGLAAHESSWVLVGAGFGLAAAALMALFARGGRRDSPGPVHEPVPPVH